MAATPTQAVGRYAHATPPCWLLAACEPMAWLWRQFMSLSVVCRRHNAAAYTGSNRRSVHVHLTARWFNSACDWGFRVVSGTGVMTRTKALSWPVCTNYRPTILFVSNPLQQGFNSNPVRLWNCLFYCQTVHRPIRIISVCFHRDTTLLLFRSFVFEI